MRVRTVVAAVLACTTFAHAQPGADYPPPEEQPPPAPEPPVSVEAPPGTTLPPINITITNNNTGNNNNTNTQTNSQTNEQAHPQTSSVPVTVTTSVTAPGAVTPPRDLVGRYEVFNPRTKIPRWITLGVSRSGVRGSIDLIARRKLTLGVAATIGHDAEHGPDRDHERPDHHGRPHVGAVVYVAHTRKLGRLELRASLGFGFGTIGGDDSRDDEIAARSTTPDVDEDRRHRRIAPRAEAALLVGLPLTKRLGLLAGPVISTTGRGHCDNAEDDDGKREVRKAVMTGLRLRF